MVTLARVAHDDPRLDRLLQLYVHEWSALVPAPIDADARYRYAGLSAWMDCVDHVAYLMIGGDGLPNGFALIVRDAHGAWHVKEFFVVAGARRRGVGAHAARALFAAHPGAWTLTVRPENPTALTFWRRVAAWTTETTEPGDDGVVRTRLRVG